MRHCPGTAENKLRTFPSTGAKRLTRGHLSVFWQVTAVSLHWTVRWQAGGFNVVADACWLHKLVTLVLYICKLHLKIIPDADRRPCEVGFLVASVHAATVCSQPNVNASGLLPFLPLCWSHTTFPCIIYMQLRPPLCIAFTSTGHKQARINWMTGIKYLWQSQNT